MPLWYYPLTIAVIALPDNYNNHDHKDGFTTSPFTELRHSRAFRRIGMVSALYMLYIFELSGHSGIWELTEKPLVPVDDDIMPPNSRFDSNVHNFAHFS